MIYNCLIICTILTLRINSFPLINEDHPRTYAAEVTHHPAILVETGTQNILTELLNHHKSTHKKTRRTTHKQKSVTEAPNLLVELNHHKPTHKKRHHTTHKKDEITTAASVSIHEFEANSGILPGPLDLIIQAVVQALTGLTGGVNGIAPADLTKYTSELTNSVKDVQTENKLPGNAKLDPSTITSIMSNLNATDSAIPAPVSDIFSGLLDKLSILKVPLDKILEVLGKVTDQTKAIQ
uniref:Secreted protein n=1 Tax=Rhabditophanes sp. KR3021 TaxID=114890 RepID=A0AC35U1N0_9BILA